jgi:hypothetical protein
MGGKKAGNAASQNTRFARTGPSNDEQSVTPELDRLTLLRVETIEKNLWQLGHIGPSLEPSTATFASLRA